MLSPFQQRLLGIVADLPEATGFALAGGAALISTGLVDRRTDDLDFFTDHRTMTEGAVTGLLRAVDEALAGADIAVEREFATATFGRVRASDGTEECRIDVAADVRIRDLDRRAGVATLNVDELAADKTLALFGRAAARDFVDVAALRQRFGWHQLFALATEKDAGFSAARFLDGLQAFDRLDEAEFDLDHAEYARLRDDVHGWRRELARGVADDRGLGL